MPTLNEYDVDNEKDGHFIRANVGGNHPITLQVTVVASRIFKALNYADGDAVPTELVWSMYDLNMVYTLSSVDVEQETNNIDPADVLEKLDLNNQLTEDERAELISYLKAYEGPDADKIQQLKEELLANTSAGALEESNMSGGAWFPSFNQLPETKQEVIDLFRRWCDDAMFERAQKAVLVHEKFVIWSVRTFAAHDNLHENPIDRIEDKEIVYRLTPPEGNKMVIVADCRGHNRSLSRENAPDVEYDYRIKRTLSDGTHETAYKKI